MLPVPGWAGGVVAGLLDGTAADGVKADFIGT